MKLRYINIILFTAIGIAIVLFAPAVKAQQFPAYTQYMNNQTPVNSAYSLLDKNGSVNALLRRQWSGIDGTPSTFIFNGQLPIPSIGAAAGIIVVNDQFAIEKLNEVNGFFAKAIQLGQNQYLGVSINAGIRRYTANYSALDPTDPAFSNDLRETRGNLGFGVMFYSDNYYLGVSVPQLSIKQLGNASASKNDYFRNHYNFSGAILLGDANNEVRMKPAALFSYTKGLPLVADLSSTLYFKNTFGVGLNYRTNNEAAGILSFVYNTLNVGYSYQFGTSSNTLSRFTFATHEIVIGYRFGKNLDKVRIL